MICRGCGNQNARMTHSGRDWEVCDVCGDARNVLVPDLHFVPGKPEVNLPDDPTTGKPPVFQTRREMAAYLKKHHLVQVRDREHGGPAIPPAVPKVDRSASYDRTRRMLKMFKEMGRDRFRQELYKVRGYR